jgi:hypothetical protein
LLYWEPFSKKKQVDEFGLIDMEAAEDSNTQGDFFFFFIKIKV